MDISDKEKLTRLGDMSKLACSIRLLAARKSIQLSQVQFSENCGIPNNSINNMEKGRQFPNRVVMKYLYRAHRVDFNFLMHGDFSQLPLDVQDRLFPQLLDATNELDRKQD